MAIKARWPLKTTGTEVDTVQSANLWDSFVRAGTNATSRGSDGYLDTYAANAPRWEYDVNGNLLGLLAEADKTEKMLSGQTTIDGISGWTFSSMSNTSNTLTDLFGAATSADQVADLDDATSDIPYITHNVTVTTGVRYTFSIFLKNVTAGTSSGGWVYLQPTSYTGVTARTWFDLENGTMGTEQGTQNFASGMDEYADGWWRCWITADIDADAVGSFRMYMCSADASTSSYVTDGKVVGVWGAQVEQTATVYGPTSFCSGNRSADDPQPASISSWYTSDTANSVYFEAYRYSDVSRLRSVNFFEMYQSISNNILFDASTGYQPVVDKNGDTIGDDTGAAWTARNTYRFAARLANNDMAIASSEDTDPLTEDSAVTWPPTTDYTSISLGTASGGFTGPTWNNGIIITDIIIYDTGLTDAELIDLATNGVAAPGGGGTGRRVSLTRGLTTGLTRGLARNLAN